MGRFRRLAGAGHPAAIDTLSRTAELKGSVWAAGKTLLDRAIADGLGNPEIAERLHITIATVKAHTGNLFAKPAVENRVQIALLVRDAVQ